MKTNVVLIIIIIAMSAVMVKLFESNSNKAKQINSLENNQANLLGQVNRFRTENGILVEKSNQLQLTVDELREYNLISEKELKELNVKYKNLQSYLNLEIESKRDTTVVVKDSIVYIDSSLVKARTFNYSDNWYSCKGTFYGDKVDLDMSCRHKINTASEVIYKGWWIFKRPKKVEVTVWVSNPKDTITKNIVIDVVKKRKYRKL